MLSVSQSSSVVTENFGYLFVCSLSKALWCEMENLTIQKSGQGFILYCSFSLLLFLLHHSSCSVEYIGPLCTQSLTALVWDKADIFILPPPHFTLQGTQHSSSGGHFLIEKTYMLPRVSTHMHSHTLRQWEANAFPFLINAQSSAWQTDVEDSCYWSYLPWSPLGF